MKVRLPDKYEPEKIAEILSRVLAQLEVIAKDKKLNKLTTLGTEPTDDLEDLDVGLFVDPSDNGHKLNIRSQGRNWAVSLTEET